MQIAEQQRKARAEFAAKRIAEAKVLSPACRSRRPTSMGGRKVADGTSVRFDIS
jgi:hypothetical protein